MPNYQDYRKNVRVFLGGTCKGMDWRANILPKLAVPYFNPHITDREWTEADRDLELKERRYDCTHYVYVITSGAVGFYSCVEATEDIILKTSQTHVCFLEDPESPWTKEQLASVAATKALFKSYTRNVHENLDDLVRAINSLH